MGKAMFQPTQDYLWRRYFSHLKGQGTERRKQLSINNLMTILNKQNGRCALTGIEMTCELGSGRVWTNASIDRIIAGGTYYPHNVQLVCVAVNMWRDAQPLSMFIHWCHLVAQHNPDTIGEAHRRAVESEERYHDQLMEWIDYVQHKLP
jgi:hypothetical protein